nr:hypothetical protein Iba_chr02fCG8000 [Ipomoea batatas]
MDEEVKEAADVKGDVRDEFAVLPVCLHRYPHVYGVRYPAGSRHFCRSSLPSFTRLLGFWGKEKQNIEIVALFMDLRLPATFKDMNFDKKRLGLDCILLKEHHGIYLGSVLVLHGVFFEPDGGELLCILLHIMAQLCNLRLDCITGLQGGHKTISQIFRSIQEWLKMQTLSCSLYFDSYLHCFVEVFCNFHKVFFDESPGGTIAEMSPGTVFLLAAMWTDSSTFSTLEPSIPYSPTPNGSQFHQKPVHSPSQPKSTRLNNPVTASYIEIV